MSRFGGSLVDPTPTSKFGGSPVSKFQTPEPTVTPMPDNHAGSVGYFSQPRGPLDELDAAFERGVKSLNEAPGRALHAILPTSVQEYLGMLDPWGQPREGGVVPLNSRRADAIAPSTLPEGTGLAKRSFYGGINLAGEIAPALVAGVATGGLAAPALGAAGLTTTSGAGTLTSLAAQGAAVGSPFAAQTVGDVYERTGSTPAALGAGAIATAAGVIPGLSEAPFGKLATQFGLGPVAKYLTTQAAEVASGAVVNLGQTAGVEGVARLAGAEPQPIDVGGALAAGAGLTAGFSALRAPGAAREVLSQRAAKAASESLVKDRLITPTEASAIGGDRKLMAELVGRRLDDEKVSLVTTDGVTTIRSEGKDSVPWRMQEALDHNPVAIDFQRQEIAANRQPPFMEPTRLPPTRTEIDDTVSRLIKLKDSIKLEPTDFTEANLPATERALLASDLENQIQKLSDSPTRLKVQQAQALDNLAQTKRDSVELIAEPLSNARSSTTDILSPIDMRPVNKFYFPLVGSDQKGYFKAPTDLAKSKTTQDRIARIQKVTLERVSALRNDADLTPEIKTALTKVYDAEHQSKVEAALGKDSTRSRTQAQVAKALSQSPIKDARKLEALSTLDKAFDSVARHTENESVKSLIDRVGVEVKDASPEVRAIVESARGPTREGAGWSDLVNKYAYEEFLNRSAKGDVGDQASDYAKAETRLRRELLDVAEGPRRDAVVADLAKLSPEQSRPFLAELRGAKSPADLAKVAGDIRLARQSVERVEKTSKLKDVPQRLATNPKRDEVMKLYAGLTPEPRAKGREPPERPIKPVITFDGKDYKAETGETSHWAMFDRVAGLVPKSKQGVYWDKATTGELSRFETSKGRIITPDEAQSMVGAGSPTSDAILTKPTSETPSQKSTIDSSKPSESKPAVRVDPKTGYREIDPKALEKKLDGLSHDELTAFHNQVVATARQGRLEQGTYRKYLGMVEKQAVRVAAEIKNTRRDVLQRHDSAAHVAGLALDPVTTEGLLAQWSKFDPRSILYKTFHGDLVNGMTANLQNQADATRFLSEATAKYLGYDYESVSGRAKLGRYLLQPVDGKITRGEAMNAYALSSDVGRGVDLADKGLIKRGETYKAHDAISKLTQKDLDFVDHVKSYLKNNPVYEKMFSTFTLLNGYRPPEVDRYWPSSRKPHEVQGQSDYSTYTTSVTRDFDNLKDRADHASAPFDAKDFVSEFLRINKQASTYAELGKELYSAQKTLYDPDVKAAINKSKGAAEFKRLQLYLSDVMGQIGHQPTAFDEAINKAISGYTVSRIALNAASAAKQYLHLMTMAADGTVSLKSLGQALAEGGAFSKRIDREMTANSGLAYLRYHGHFLQDLMVMSESNKQPSKLQQIQHHSLVFQRNADRQVMRVAWRAAELESAAKGLKGQAARDETSRIFNIVAGRDQPTSNPLYGGELEVQAKRQPLLRGTLMFARESNRIYNVVRRRVVEAAQNPTPENVGKAGRAILFGVVGNTLGIVGVNALRRAVFDKPTTDTDVAKDALGSAVGMYYLGTPVEGLIDFALNPTKKTSDSRGGPIASLAADVVSTVTSAVKAGQAGDAEVKSGLHRGESRATTEVLKAVDSGLSSASGLLGLPLWSLWYQGRGLYNWSRPDYRLMIEFEQERQQLKADGRESSPRYAELESARKSINSIHAHRASGLASESEAQRGIVRELEKVRR